MREDLYQPSLQNDSWQETQSYDIGKLFYVAFFGGVIPIVVLGSRNALWLKVEKKIIYLLVSCGVILLLVKLSLVIAMFNKTIAMESRTIRLIMRAGSILLYLLFYLAMKKRFQQHMVTDGELIPLLKDALIWIGIGIVAEFGIFSVIGLRLTK